MALPISAIPAAEMPAGEALGTRLGHISVETNQLQKGRTSRVHRPNNNDNGRTSMLKSSHFRRMANTEEGLQIES
jgi:hypothetical protein